jgi:hypothetical protein
MTLASQFPSKLEGISKHTGALGMVYASCGGGGEQVNISVSITPAVSFFLLCYFRKSSRDRLE